MGGFKIYRRGSWRSLDVEKGRLEGARTDDIQFLMLSGGMAVKLSSKEVFRQLRRFARGKPSRVVHGTELKYQTGDRGVSAAGTHTDNLRRRLSTKNNNESGRTIQESRPTLEPRPRASSTLDQHQFAKSLDLAPSEDTSTATVATVPRKLRNTSERTLDRPRWLPYEEVEDICIVSWLSAESSRVSGVGGVIVWRELSAEFPKLCKGHTRTWHSLKNRYLRMLLPSLRNPDSELSSLVSQKCRSRLLAKKKKSLESSLVKKLNDVRSGASSRRIGVLAKDKSVDLTEKSTQGVNTRGNRRKLYNF